MPALSVVMPAYNEEMTIADAMADVVKHVVPAAGDVEFIVIDDGSKDRTAEIVAGYQAQYPFIRLVKQANAGHGAALRHGIDVSTGDWLLLLDSDCQIGLQEFAAHWSSRDTYDAFLGVRLPRRDPALRLVISALMKAALRLYAGVAPQDGGAPYKIVSRRAWKASSGLIKPGSWIPSVLLAASLLKNNSLRVVQTPVAHFERPHGESTLNAKRLMRFCWFALAEIRVFGAAVKSAAFGAYVHESAD